MWRFPLRRRLNELWSGVERGRHLKGKEAPARGSNLRDGETRTKGRRPHNEIRCLETGVLSPTKKKTDD